MVQLKMEIVIEAYGLSRLVNTAYGKANKQIRQQILFPKEHWKLL